MKRGGRNRREWRGVKNGVGGIGRRKNRKPAAGVAKARRLCKVAVKIDAVVSNDGIIRGLRRSVNASVRQQQKKNGEKQRWLATQLAAAAAK